MAKPYDGFVEFISDLILSKKDHMKGLAKI